MLCIGPLAHCGRASNMQFYSEWPHLPLEFAMHATVRPRLRFTLRVLLGIVTLLGVGLGIWTHRAREQRSIVAKITSAGGNVKYDDAIEPYPINGPAPRVPPVSAVPRSLLDLVGEDYFHNVAEVETLDLAIVPRLNRLRWLKSLTIVNESLTDATFAPVAKLRGLKVLLVQPNADGPAVTHIGDPSLSLIADLPRLEYALLMGSEITSQGLAKLAKSQSLRRIDVVSYHPSVDTGAAMPLQQSGRLSGNIQRWSPNGGGTTVASW
jgi:hypothetical protein